MEFLEIETVSKHSLPELKITKDLTDVSYTLYHPGVVFVPALGYIYYTGTDTFIMCSSCYSQDTWTKS